MDKNKLFKDEIKWINFSAEANGMWIYNNSRFEEASAESFACHKQPLPLCFELVSEPVIFLVEQQKRGTFVALHGVSGEISANEKEETKHMTIILVNKQKWFDTGLKNVQTNVS